MFYFFFLFRFFSFSFLFFFFFWHNKDDDLKGPTSPVYLFSDLSLGYRGLEGEGKEQLVFWFGVC